MITPKMIAEKTMTPEKKGLAHNDIIAFYVGRNLSYIFTIPFLYTNIRPDTISRISLIPTIIGFLIQIFTKSKIGLLIACLFYFIQDMFDGIDGNVARYRGQFSTYGSVWDAMSGYFMGCLCFLGTGVSAAHFEGALGTIIPKELYIILGAITGMAVIFPRLVMHKAITTAGKTETISEIKDKQNFGLIQIIALNLSSTAGGVQVLRLFAIICNIQDLYIICYCIFFLIMAVYTINKALKEKKQ